MNRRVRVFPHPEKARILSLWGASRVGRIPFKMVWKKAEHTVLLAQVHIRINCCMRGERSAHTHTHTHTYTHTHTHTYTQSHHKAGYHTNGGPLKNGSKRQKMAARGLKISGMRI
jgi:hypothetical protein